MTRPPSRAGVIAEMEPSEEIRAVVLRFIDSMREGDDHA